MGVIMRMLAVIGLLLTISPSYSAESNELSEVQVMELEKAIAAGDRAAIHTLFNTHADGAVAEEIDVALGALIPLNPTLFLEGLGESWQANCERCIDSLVANTGEALVDQPNAQLKELKVRRAALVGVNNQELAALRATCLGALDRAILQLESVQAEGDSAK